METDTIIIINSLIEVESQRKLNVEELFLYSYLWTERTYENHVKTNIDMLNEDVELLKDKKQNKKRLKQTLDSLLEKKLIIVEEKGKLLKIIFNRFEGEGYVGISYKKFRELLPLELFVYVLVKKWNDGAKYSYSLWGELLNCTARHAKNIIKEAIEKGIIYKLEGTYTAAIVNGRKQKKQDVNTYSTKPFLTSEVVEKEEQPIDDKKAQKAVAQQLSDMEQAEKEGHQWYSKGRVNFTVNDFIVYLTTEDEELKKVAKTHIDRISKTEKGEWVMNNKMSQAKEEIANKANKDKQSKERAIEKKAEELIDETDDIVLLVDDKLVKYSDFNKDSMKARKVFYYTMEDFGEGYGTLIASAPNPFNVDVYRKENGNWKGQWQIHDYDEYNYDEYNYDEYNHDT